MRYLIMCFLIILLANCATTNSNRNLNNGTNNYRGKDVDDVINRLGMPDKLILTRQGDRVYIFNKSHPNYAKLSSTPPVGVNVNSAGAPVIIVKSQLNTLQPANLAFSCTIILRTNNEGRILQSKATGEGC